MEFCVIQVHLSEMRIFGSTILFLSYADDR
jgi:hypothetical protein